MWIKAFALFLFLCLSCDTKRDFEGEANYFLRYYGEDGNQEAVDMAVNADGTVLLLGNTSVPDSAQRISLTKVDVHGNILWRKKFGSGSDAQGNSISEFAQDIEPEAAGTFLILSNMLRGKDPSTNEDLFDFKVLRISADGALLGSMEFKNNKPTRDWITQKAAGITALPNGGFVIAGNSTNENLYTEPAGLKPPDLEDIFCIGFKSDFSVAWNTVEFSDPTGTSLGEHYGSGIKVFEKSPGDYYLFAYSDGIYNEDNTDANYESNFNVFAFTANGLPSANPINVYGDPARNERLASVCQVPPQLGGGYYMLGTSSTGQDTEGILYFSKATNSMTLQQQGIVNGLSGSFKAVDVAPAVAGAQGFLILATETVNPGTTIRLVKVNTNSDVQWSMNLGSFDTRNYGATVEELPDGRILLFGTVELGTQRKMVLAKLNAQGEFLN